MLSQKQTLQRAIPKLPGLPFLGNIREFRSNRLDLLLRVSQECGDIGIFRVGPWPVVLVNSPEYVYNVLVANADAFEKAPLLRQHLRPLLGNGLVSSENEFHKRQRQLIAPAFQHHRIATSAEVIAAYAERIQDDWADGTTINIGDEMMRLTLWIVGKTLFGADVLSEAAEMRATLTTIAHVANDMANTLIRVPASWPTRRNQHFRQAITRLDATIGRIIEQRRQANHDQGDLLSMLLHAQDEDDGSFMTDQQVRDEAITLFIAGHETTAQALTWTWYLLTQHPAVYAQLRTEVDRVLGGRTPTSTDLPALPYTLQVFKEALRLYPPSWVILRQAQQSVGVGNYELPRGMRVAVSPYTLHRRPDDFPHPEEFDPDRFTLQAETHRPRYAYLPFGAGPRVCIGNHFALMEAHLILSALIQRVTFELVPRQQIEPEPLITLRPKGGIKVVVRRR
jgi:cytochrome P450